MRRTDPPNEGVVLGLLALGVGLAALFSFLIFLATQ